MSLQTLIDEVAAAVARGAGERETTTAVAESVRAALADGLTLPPGTETPDPDHYVMYPLHVAEDGSFSIASAVWGVGQATPIHDHTVWGVVGIHSGVEREQRFELDPDGVPLPGEVHEWQPGQVTVCCTTDADLHRVECASPEPCVGIHIYGGDIGRVLRHSFAPGSGQVKEFVSAWVEPGR